MMIPFSLRRLEPVLHSIQRNKCGSFMTVSGRKLRDLSITSPVKTKRARSVANKDIQRIRTSCGKPRCLSGSVTEADVRTVGRTPAETLIRWLIHLINLDRHPGSGWGFVETGVAAGRPLGPVFGQQSQGGLIK